MNLMNIIKKIKAKIHAHFNDEYELTVWFVKESLHDIEGNLKMCQKTQPMVYNLSSISKKTNTHIVGKDMEGKPIEILTTIPFDFQIRKLY